MGVTYNFIHDPLEPSPVLSWFRALVPGPREIQFDWGWALHFEACGPIQYLADGTIDANHSPVAALVLPILRRGVLWTVGELRIPATPLKSQYLALHRVSLAFSEWLGNFHRVFSSKGEAQGFDYQFEGSVRNTCKEIFAFKSGLDALNGGRYFIANSDNDALLDKVCKQLRLRGVECQS
jgi:hypothetical protein